MHAALQRPDTEYGEEGPAGEIGYWEGEDYRLVAQWTPPEDRGGEWALYAAPEFLGDLLPLGAVVATARLVDVVPIVSEPILHQRCVGLDEDGLVRDWKPMTLSHPPSESHGHWAEATTEHEASLGDFTPGRYAWLLADVEPLAEPIPARGQRGLWNWEAAAT